MKKIVVLSLLLCFVGCSGLFSTPIGKIIDNPRDFEGKTVTVKGEVAEVYSLFILRYFVVKDSTGSMTVITQRILPKKGAEITVRGKVQEAFSLGDKQLLVLIEEEDKTSLQPQEQEPYQEH